MGQHSEHFFDFDKLDLLIAEALEDNELAMRPILRPGEIGSVPVRMSTDLELPNEQSQATYPLT